MAQRQTDVVSLYQGVQVAGSVKHGNFHVQGHQVAHVRAAPKYMEIQSITSLPTDPFVGSQFFDFQINCQGQIDMIEKLRLLVSLRNSTGGAAAFPAAYLMIQRIELLVNDQSTPIWAIGGELLHILYCQQTSSEKYATQAAYLNYDATTTYTGNASTLANGSTTALQLDILGCPLTVANVFLPSLTQCTLRVWMNSSATLNITSGSSGFNITSIKLAMDCIELSGDQRAQKRKEAAEGVNYRYLYPRYFTQDITTVSGSDYSLQLSSVPGDQNIIWFGLRAQSSTGNNLITYTTSSAASAAALVSASGEYMLSNTSIGTDVLSKRLGEVFDMSKFYTSSQKLYAFIPSFAPQKDIALGTSHGEISLSSTDILRLTASASASCTLCIYALGRANLTVRGSQARATY